MDAKRPKLEVVRPDDETVELYIDGKYILGACHDEHGTVGMEAIQAAARHVAKALGADVVPVDEPSPQLYVYRLAWHAGGRFGSSWCRRSDPIENEADEDRVREALMADSGFAHELHGAHYPIFLNIEFISGPC